MTAFSTHLFSNLSGYFATFLKTANLVGKRPDSQVIMMENVKDSENWLGALSNLEEVDSYTKHIFQTSSGERIEIDEIERRKNSRISGKRVNCWAFQCMRL